MRHTPLVTWSCRQYRGILEGNFDNWNKVIEAIEPQHLNHNTVAWACRVDVKLAALEIVATDQLWQVDFAFWSISVTMLSVEIKCYGFLSTIPCIRRNPTEKTWNFPHSCFQIGQAGSGFRRQSLWVLVQVKTSGEECRSLDFEPKFLPPS